jgi:hypothetical protein
VSVWFDESPVSFTATLALALVAFCLLWFLALRPARAPAALLSLALQPVVDDRGLQGAAGGGRDANQPESERSPMSGIDSADSSEPALAVPEIDPADSPEAPREKLKPDPDSGNVADVLRESASDLEKAQAMLPASGEKPEAERSQENPTPTRTSSATDRTKRLARSSGRLPTSPGGENRSGGMGADGAAEQSARFFGLGAEDTKSVVYVIDCSGSMGRPPQKLLVAQEELARSIQALQPNQRFFVIFFNDRMIPMRGNELLAATDANKDEACEWLATAFSGGGTNPLPAIHHALQLQPETIYVLSDGLFKSEYVREVQRRNRGDQRATIYTIGFGDRSGEDQLRRLARENGGSYRFVQP